METMLNGEDCFVLVNKASARVTVVPAEPGVSTASVTIDDKKIDRLTSPRGVCFYDINYEVTQRKCCKKLPNKRILNNVNGLMLPGLNAILGPTGSGKTSLLDILAGRKNKKGLSGKVLVNGERQPDNFKCISGYVVQDDVVMGTLTVRENLFFSAALRLPTRMTWAERKRRVEKVLNELGLTDCANTKIGTEFFRGVSGGERKRTNIGMELIIEPQVLFLDEPTTGLDAYTAVSVVKLLKQLCYNNSERIVIMSIHQPRYSIFKLFDTLTLLSRGDLVYHGPRHMALEHFSRQGYICEEHDNPADFMLDVINECERQAPDIQEDSFAIEECKLANSYNQSFLGQSNNTRSKELVRQLKEKEKADGTKLKSSYTYATNFFWQLLVVIVRSVINLSRNPQASVVQIAVTVFFAIVVGALYFQIETGPNGFFDRLGVIFFMIMNQIFLNMNAVDLFIKQKALFIHENASGFYRVSVYFIAKMVTDIVPLRFIPLCFYTIIVYFMLGFQLAADKFFILFFTLFLVTVGAASIAFWISAMVNVTGVATLLTAMSFVVQLLFGGFLLALASLPDWIQWFQYFSIFRYGIEALAVNEIQGLQFTEIINGTSQTVSGDELLEIRGFDPDWLFYDWIGLAMFSVVFMTLAYITLRLLKKEK